MRFLQQFAHYRPRILGGYSRVAGLENKASSDFIRAAASVKRRLVLQPHAIPELSRVPARLPERKPPLRTERTDAAQIDTPSERYGNRRFIELEQIE